MVCAVTMTESYVGTVHTTSTCLTLIGYSEFVAEIPVTAGAEKLNGEATPRATITATGLETTGSLASTVASGSDVQATKTSGSNSDDEAALSTDPDNT